MGVPQEVWPGAFRQIDSTVLLAEAMEPPLHGCMTWAPRRDHYGLLRTIHHRLLQLLGVSAGGFYLRPGREEGRVPER